MAGLKAIKSKIKSVEKTQKVTKAMEAVSAAKMRKSQARAFGARGYARAAVSILARLSDSQTLQTHPLTDVRTVKKALYIVITSDKGLAGALNSAVLRSVQAQMLASGLEQENISVVAIGRKANDFFTARGYRVEEFFLNTDDISSDRIHSLAFGAAERFADKAVDAVYIAYQDFVSTFEQRPTLRRMLPLSRVELEKVVARSNDDPQDSLSPSLYTVEPSEEEVLSELIPKLAGIFVYHALLETQASEHSARMVAMKGASDKAGEMEHALQLQFNKARQAAITREVSEITGGMEAMAG